MSLSLVIIFRAPPVNKLHLKKKIISIYETDKYLFFSSLQSERFLVPFIRYWMKWIPISVYLINYTKYYFDVIYTKNESCESMKNFVQYSFWQIIFQKYRNIDQTSWENFNIKHTTLTTPHRIFQLNHWRLLKRENRGSFRRIIIYSTIFIATGAFLCKPPLTTKQR